MYLAESPAGALLEVLVHLELEEDELVQYKLLAVEVDDGLAIEDLSPGLPEGWRNNEAVTRAVGDAWLYAGEHLLARVPSSIMPQTFNVLYNPDHPDAGRARITRVERGQVDLRLLRRVPG